jgi:hypothetical protein
MGSGKTLLATKLVKNSNTPVIANYDIGVFKFNEDGTKELDDDGKAILLERDANTHLLELGQLFHLPYKKCKVVLDEGTVYLENRVSMSKLNLYLSYVLFQSRKRGIDIIITAQLANTIDSRFINLADIIILCQQTKEGFNYFVSNGQIIRKMFIPYKEAMKLFDSYDTGQVIMPPQMQDLETQVQILDRKELKKKIDELEKDFRLKYPDKVKVTHSLVNSYLLDEDLSEEYASYLYARLQKPIQ